MATKPINKYTVQEATNLKVYENYSYKKITCADNDTYAEGDDWTTSGDGPAKEIMIINYTGDAAGVTTLALKVGGSYGDEIELEFQDYPITISGLLIDQIKMKTADSTADEVFSVISFH
jgi:hypothetical protein